jgi:hypothetical protein
LHQQHSTGSEEVAHHGCAEWIDFGDFHGSESLADCVGQTSERADRRAISRDNYEFIAVIYEYVETGTVGVIGYGGVQIRVPVKDRDSGVLLAFQSLEKL